MTQIITHNTNDALTVQQIAEAVSRHNSSIRRKLAKHPELEAGKFIKNGQEVTAYLPKALELWNVSNDIIKASAQSVTRKSRADRGSIRSVKEELMLKAIDMTRAYFVNTPKCPLKFACEHTVKILNKCGIYEIKTSTLYNRLRRKGKTYTKNGRTYREPVGEFYGNPLAGKPNWRQLQKRNWRKKETGIDGAKLRFSNLDMLEDAGMAGAGFGVGRIIIIDDFKRDAGVTVMKDGKKQLAAPWGVAFIDALSRYPLLLLPCETVTTNVVATGIAMVAFQYGIYDDTVWMLENSKSMKNINIEGLVRSLYTDEQLRKFDNGEHQWITDLMYGQRGPIINNIPNIPSHIFKGTVERFFKLIKDEFDGIYFPGNYLGGNRTETTQLNMSSKPIIIENTYNEFIPGTYTVSMDEYWNQLFDFTYSDLINRERPVMHREFAKKYGFEPTIKNVWEFYGGLNTERIPKLTEERLAYVLYFAQPERQKNRVTIRHSGHYSCVIDGRPINITMRELHSGFIGRKVATVPIPHNENHFAIFLADDIKEPHFIGIAEDMTVTRISEAPRMRAHTSDVRRYHDQRETQEGSVKGVWELTSEVTPPVQPEATWAKEMQAKDNLAIHPEGSPSACSQGADIPRPLPSSEKRKSVDDIIEFDNDPSALDYDEANITDEAKKLLDFLNNI